MRCQFTGCEKKSETLDLTGAEKEAGWIGIILSKECLYQSDPQTMELEKDGVLCPAHHEVMLALLQR